MTRENPDTLVEEHSNPVSGELEDLGRVDQCISRVESLANLLDTRYKIPGTHFRVGWDPLIGLIPVVGDTFTVGLGGYIVLEAIRLGARKRTIVRMIWNLFLDWLFGLIPFVDILFDFGFKANARNARILVREWEAGRLKKGTKNE